MYTFSTRTLFVQSLYNVLLVPVLHKVSTRFVQVLLTLVKSLCKVPPMLYAECTICFRILYGKAIHLALLCVAS
jgi:hypothetical protein